MLELLAQRVLLNLAGRAIGKASMKSTSSGIHQLATFPSKNRQQFLARELVPGAPATRSLSRRSA